MPAKPTTDARKAGANRRTRRVVDLIDQPRCELDELPLFIVGV